jgi:hypothetical protein
MLRTINGSFAAMVHRRFGVSFVLALSISLGACAAGTPAPESAAAGSGMSSADARAFLAEVQKERGVQPGASVTSMEQFLQVLEGDEIGRFESAAAFVAGKPGIDAMTLHATLELSWSDGFSTVALIVSELGKRAAVEAKRLNDLKESGKAFSEAQEKELERAEKSVAFHAKAREALGRLAKDHLETALGPVNECLRQFPKDVRTYRVAAFYYLCAEDWEKFDTAMEWLKEGAATDPMVQTMKAGEAMKRFAIRKEARGFLTEALKLNPKLVRAQAKLVFFEEGIAATHAELEKLRAVAPRHPIVNIAGPAIDSEYETAAALERARGPQASPAAPAPPAP